jgi:uncharacterized protein (TIGR00730 family)
MVRPNPPAGKTICVFCGSTDGIAAEYATAATMIVSALVQRGYSIVYGGGRTGLMGIVADTALALGGTVTGVITEFLVDREVAHSDLTELEVTLDISERKRRMAELSDAFVALPGGLGTLEEITEVMSHSQLGLHKKPCALLNVNDYFEHLIEFIGHAAGLGFVRSEVLDQLIVESDPERLAILLSEHLFSRSSSLS